jgi:hypothetical protein
MDIVERLREHNEPPFDYIAHEAADEIEQLRKDKQLGFELMDTFIKEINRLKQVLQLIADEGSGHGQALAYAALKEPE